MYLTANVFAGDDYPNSKVTDDYNESVAQIWNDTVLDNTKIYVCGNIVQGRINDSLLELLKTLKGKITILVGDKDSNENCEIYKGLGWQVAKNAFAAEGDYYLTFGYYNIDPHLFSKDNGIICYGKESSFGNPDSINVSFNIHHALVPTEGIVENLQK